MATAPNYYLGTTWAEQQRRNPIPPFDQLADHQIREVRQGLIAYVEFLHSCLLRYKKILVYCKQGAQRSALVVCAVVMSITGLRAEQVMWKKKVPFQFE